MLQLFRNYSPFTVLILIIGAFIMKLQPLLHPVAPAALPDHVIFVFLLHCLDYVLGGNAFAYTVLSVVILFSQALFINYITIRHKLFARATYLPAFTYLLLTSINPSFNYFSEPLLINWLMLIAVNVMLTFSQTSQPRKQIFNAGFITCLPALLQFPSAAFLLLFLLALVFLRSFNIGEWVVGMLGYFTPVYFFACILFLIDRLPSLWQTVHIGFALPRRLEYPVYIVGTAAGIALLTVIGSVSVQRQLGKVTIYIRRAWGLVYTYVLVSIGVSVITVSSVNAEWLVVIPALSILIAQAFCFDKSKRFSNFTFYFSLLFLIFCQLALNK